MSRDPLGGVLPAGWRADAWPQIGHAPARGSRRALTRSSCGARLPPPPRTVTVVRSLLRERVLDALTAFGLFAVTAMLVCYAFEARSPWFILAFAGACALGSIYGFLQG